MRNLYCFLRGRIQLRILGAILLVAIFPIEAPAGQYGFVRGKVEFVRTHDPQLFAMWAPPIFWFTLEGDTSIGACAKWYGRVLLVSRDKQDYAMVLAAVTSGAVVSVYVDDANLINGYCVAMHTTIRGAGAPDVN